ncbi:GNAT family N-acetyltransferase [Neobacillus sp. SuZ13]|uniref:GNAT family N-acetyltransferase n=1 Tax=Neobacillus sp. SuZ13 TaxID=3047875 RepID=UPI0024BF4F2A|nr:GNAT family N-acetyltransferase [Neobacillus sp. SuZ13]WHY69164.1 GNAT family N-acetyltransferase [Neobacillus sp. SuZ13]
MINLVKVLKEDENILHNLMQFYIYEFTKFLPEITLEDNGLYRPYDLTEFWISPNHHPFFIKQDDELIGFALVENGIEEEPNSILEFFIIQKHAGRGFGKIAANQLFTIFPGKWQITQIEKNYPAQAFWRNTISKFTGGSYSERSDERKRVIQEFDTNL